MKNAQRLAFITVATTIILIGLGTFVRATGSGLGCPDWPTCHGRVVPPGDETAIIEFSHRFVASIVGFMVIGTAFMAWRHYRDVPVVFWAAVLAVPLVGFQGILGAITVVRELPAEVVATHLVTAMVVLGFELIVAWGMYNEDPERRVRAMRSRSAGLVPGRLALAGLVWLAVLFWVGGYVAESGAATACEGWPLCNGSVVPDDEQEVTHMLHRYLAAGFLVVLVPLGVATWRARGQLWWAGPAVLAGAVAYVAQVLIGALNVWYTFPDALTVLHTLVATCVWAVLASVCVLGLYRPVAERRVRPLSGREVPA